MYLLQDSMWHDSDGGIKGASKKMLKGTQIARASKRRPFCENIKCLCWVLYFSFNTAYKSVIGVKMNMYSKQQVYARENNQVLALIRYWRE